MGSDFSLDTGYLIAVAMLYENNHVVISSVEVKPVKRIIQLVQKRAIDAVLQIYPVVLYSCKSRDIA